ncbi:hypothetical protein GUJ93_ZPchr0008g13759 [Zizania palustris]|uniref:Phytocyanin domain-containing protein n=1 Tax=Zizania palustris TaxID=103762 RepID=A0A8J5RK50_ZIZPA|nr:hypothetical protein GUJ93_ZPchr0008g13759 [Zizania palustris]
MAIMAAAKALVVVVMAATVVGTALGATHTVGAPNGSWDLQTNYAQWVSNIRFSVGDQLVFKYSPSMHDVVELSKADYDACSSAAPIATFNSGDDTIPLTAAGTRYFICGIGNHCNNGMKVTVKVEASAATGSNPAAPPPMAPPRAGSPPPPAVASPPAATGGDRPAPPSSSAAKSAGVESLVGLGVAAVAAGLVMFY